MTVDRIEENIAVFTGDNEQTFHLPLESICFDLSEGDICNAEMRDDLLIILSKNEEAKASRNALINDLFNKLKRRKKC